MSKYMFFIEGINADLEDINGWHDRAEDWVDQNTDHKANSYNYHVTALTRWLYQSKNITKAATCIERGWNKQREQLIVCGHSNGCAISCGLLDADPALMIGELHLIAGAVDADFDKNGLNAAMARQQVGKVFMYCSKSDRALQIAQNTSWIHKLYSKWGYGSMGLTGPTNVKAPERVVTEWFEGFDHSTYFEGTNFETTMRLVCGTV